MKPRMQGSQRGTSRAARAAGLGAALLWAAALTVGAAAQASPEGAVPDGVQARGERRGGHGPRGGDVGMFLGRLGDEIGLNEDQKQKIKGILESARPEMESVRNQLRSTRARLDGITPSDAAWNSTVAEVSRTSGELTTRMVANGAQVQAQVWAVLTPEQRTRATALRAQMKERMRERRERRGASS